MPWPADTKLSGTPELIVEQTTVLTCAVGCAGLTRTLAAVQRPHAVTAFPVTLPHASSAATWGELGGSSQLLE